MRINSKNMFKSIVTTEKRLNAIEKRIFFKEQRLLQSQQNSINFMKFFDDVFFPYLEENNIHTIIHAGDLMDRRKYVNFNILNQVRTRFIKKIKDQTNYMKANLGGFK